MRKSIQGMHMSQSACGDIRIGYEFSMLSEKRSHSDKVEM